MISSDHQVEQDVKKEIEGLLEANEKENKELEEDREKYPSTYMMKMMSQHMMKAMGVPKEL